MEHLHLDKYYRLVANCIPTKGAARSVICDLHRSQLTFIPNDLYEILQGCTRLTINEIVAEYGEDNRATILSYFNLLLREEYIFWCDSKEELALFPDMDLSFEHPAIISNAIIDLDKHSSYSIEKVVKELEQLGCRHVQIRVFDPLAFTEVLEIASLFDNLGIRSLNMALHYSEELVEDKITQLLDKQKRVVEVLVHSAPQTKPISPQARYTEERITDATHCGFVDPSFFSVNIPTFTEAQTHNSCLHKKISVDADGLIRNCPALPDTFGHIDETALVEALNDEKLKAYWDINKDQISICSDCEFRYVCVDCRAFVKDADASSNAYGKPSKCTYDPYLMKWES